MQLDTQTVEILSQVSTATLTTLLLRKGLRNVWLRGTRPLRAVNPSIRPLACACDSVQRHCAGRRRRQ